jgi:hypothetical protein
MTEKENPKEALEKFIHGLSLTREDFHTLLTRGILVENNEPASYEAFMMLHYEDADVMGYIDLLAPPRCENTSGVRRVVRLRLGNEICPEDVRVSKLTSRQREFLQAEYPDIFKRFRNE